VTAPAAGRRLIVEADGGSRGNPGPAGYGAVVRDAATGAVFAEVSEAIGVATNNVAEYRGMIAGLREAVRVDPACTVEVRMDSRLVVEQMAGRWAIRHEDMRRLAEEARGVLPAERVSYTWVPREANAEADRLANRAMDAAATGASPGGGSGPGTASGSSPTAGPGRPEPLPGASGAATTLVLARHGRTEHTEQGVMSGGGSDPGLSPAGVADARALAAAVAQLGGSGSPLLAGLGAVTRVESSPQQRARQTAALVAERAGLGEVAVEDGWREVSLGEWEGLSVAEATRRWPERLREWYGATDAGAPGGESLDALATRVLAQRQRTVEADPGAVVLVVTHGGPVAVVVSEVLQADVRAVWRVRVDPCSLTVVRYWPDGGAQLVTANATGHLVAAPLGAV